MALSLLEYLTQLATDTNMIKSYKEDREKAMIDCGVSEEDIKLVLENDYETIKKLLGPEYGISINHIIDVFRK